MTDLFQSQSDVQEWPRITAARICAMPDIEDRRRELERVPSCIRDLVKAHVADYFWRKKYARA